MIEKVRELNDEFRKNMLTSGRNRVLMTRNLLEKFDMDSINFLLKKVSTFDAFTEDNDPWKEHDFGSLRHGGERIFWKIDYYDETLLYHSEDKADPDKTIRVLTIMLASDY